VLVLRDVLGFRAAEVAEMLDSTVSAVNSALKRARATLAQKLPAPAERQPAQDSTADDAIVTSFAEAYEAADVDAVVALLTDDVFISMPPMPFEYEDGTLRPGSSPPSSVRADASGWCRPGPMASRPSGPTYWAPTASATVLGSLSSHSPTTGSAP
jgi:hypothetical protein